MNFRKTFLICLIILTYFQAKSQDHIISGVVVDAATKDPLPFVSVVITGEKEGVVADIDGKFSIKLVDGKSGLSFAYVGYNTLNITLDKTLKSIKAEMIKSSYSLKEVVILPGENPAEKIIKKAVDNRDANNPMKLRSFSYDSYNKFIYSMNTDSLRKIKGDSGVIKFLDKHHLFLSESFSHRTFLGPDNSKEIVLATKVSGISQPSFAILATEFQSFTFYDEIIRVYEKNYINPISKGSENRYLFILEDTLFGDKADTAFVISFRPKVGKNFDGLKGLLYINTDGFALQNVIAEPYDKKRGGGSLAVDVKIQQKYERVDGKWFPHQLNADMIFGAGDSGKVSNIMGISRSYLENVKINPSLSKKDFDNVSIEYKDDASQKPDSFWASHRTDTLNLKEKNTYKAIDSIGKKYNLDKKLILLEALINGQFPWGKFNIDLDKIFNYSTYEGWRLGFGMHTSNAISKRFVVGGYTAYGFGDRTWKYGYDARIPIYKQKEISVGYTFSYDVSEAGGYSFYNDNSSGSLSNESFRTYLVEVMDNTQLKEIDLRLRALKYCELKMYASNYSKYSTDLYSFKNQGTSNFTFSESGVKLRFAYGEKIIKASRYQAAQPTKYPILWFNFSKGFTGVMKGEFDYVKMEAKVQKFFYVKGLGKPGIQISGGLANGELPYSNLYAGKAGYENFGISMDNVFQTMRMNEFLSDRFVSVFTSHNFEKLLYKGKKFQPTLTVVNNITFGTLQNPQLHLNRSFKTMEKGYYETGLVVNNLLHSSFMALGLGAYYRYGAYSYEKKAKNFAFTLAYMISL